MDWNEIAPMLVLITLIVVTGGVVLLRPLSRRLGDLLEVMTRERRDLSSLDDAARLREAMASLESRVALLEERQNFTESLLASGVPRAGSVLPPGGGGAPERDLVDRAQAQPRP